MTYVSGETSEPVAISQLKSLIQLSESCIQSFHYDCTLAPLRNENIDYAWWTDREGEQNIYFTGQSKGYHVCDCHFEDKGCFDSDTQVN